MPVTFTEKLEPIGQYHTCTVAERIFNVPRGCYPIESRRGGAGSNFPVENFKSSIVEGRNGRKRHLLVGCGEFFDGSGIL